MAQPFIGEIRMFAGNFAPAGWMFCSGQLLPISENDALFTLIGTTYGGDGQETFALPNLQSRIPIHFGTGPDGVNYQLAEASGTESVTLSVQQIPVHTHAHMAHNNVGGQASADPTNGVAAPSDLSQYSTAGADGNTQMGSPALTSDPVGGSQPHENCQPFLCINYIISLFRLFPPPN